MIKNHTYLGSTPRSPPNGSILVSAPKKQPLLIAKPQSFTLNLTDRIPLEMIAISGGKFWMGSPDGEGDDSERPRHEVTIAPFFMQVSNYSSAISGGDGEESLFA